MSFENVVFLLLFFALWTVLVISVFGRFVVRLQKSGQTLMSYARDGLQSDDDDNDDDDDLFKDSPSHIVGGSNTPMNLRGAMGPQGEKGEKGEPGRNAVCVCGPTLMLPEGWQRAYVDANGKVFGEHEMVTSKIMKKKSVDEKDTDDD